MPPPQCLPQPLLAHRCIIQVTKLRSAALEKPTPGVVAGLVEAARRELEEAAAARGLPRSACDAAGALQVGVAAGDGTASIMGTPESVAAPGSRAHSRPSSAAQLDTEKQARGSP